MLEMNRLWAGTSLASRASTEHELLTSQITGAGSNPLTFSPHGRLRSGSVGKLTFSRVVKTNCSGNESGG